MQISSRTPEGEPFECPICGEVAALMTSDAGDSVCPACGQLLWELRDAASRMGIAIEPAGREHLDPELGIDSLELVELVMSLEDRLGGEWSAEEMRGITSVRDVVRWLRRRERER